MRNGYGNCPHSQEWLRHEGEIGVMTLGFADFGAGLG
jgi:hypothetical protein